MPEAQLIDVADGGVLCFDDVGDPAGAPVVYLHGTPDSRRARHPDDSLAAAAGVRLLAVDRPGYGGSTFRGDLAPALQELLDGLGVERTAVLGWSGGTFDALRTAVSPTLAGRITALHLVGALVPLDAYTDPEVRLAGAGRLDLIEMAESMPADVLAAEVAPMMAPYPCDRDLALEHQRHSRESAEQARLAAVPGAVGQMGDSLVEAVCDGLAGVEADVAAQIRPLGLDLTTLTTPTYLWYGSDDPTTPPAFGRWYAAQLPNAALQVVPDAGHFLPFTHWDQLLRGSRGTAPPG